MVFAGLLMKIMENTVIAESELIINHRGAIYHLNVRPEELAETVILVGDPGRVAKISDRFDAVEHRCQNREFVTHTGRVGQKRITALSTGIGSDNIDIVINELDALVNIDLDSRTIKPKKTSLRLVRLGTSGSLQPDIPVDSPLLSTHGIGFDGVLPYYAAVETVCDNHIQTQLNQYINWPRGMGHAYVCAANQGLIELLSPGMFLGMTATANGFYGPQGRVLRLATRMPDLNTKLASFRFGELRITNFEMETSALYGLGAALGHQCATVCAIIANRFRKEYTKDHDTTVGKLIDTLLERL